MALDCLNNIVGLSNTTCNCWDSSKPIDFNTLNASSSGLYVSQPDTIPLRFAGGAADCENNGIWSLLIAARDKAVRDLQKDFLTTTQERKSERFLPFTKIGDTYFNKSQIVRTGTTHFAAKLYPYKIKGAKLRIDSVQIAFWSGIVAPTNVKIDIYSSLDLTSVLATTTANVTANKILTTATFATAFEKDLGDVRYDLDEYFFIVYECPIGAVPVSNNVQIGCGCKGKANNILDNPFLQIMEVTGVQSSSIANLSSPISQQSTMQGLVLNASMECDYYSWLCDLAQELLQTTNIGGQRARLGMALADGIQAKAVMNLVDSILNSSKINYYTMILDPNHLFAIKNKFKGIYELAISNLSYYMPSDVSDCLVCAENKTIQKGQILV